RHEDFRLWLEHAAGGARIGRPYILDDDDRYAGIARRRHIGNDGQRAAHHCVRDELVSMDLGSRQREEDVARLDPAAVGIKTENRSQALLGPGARAFEQLGYTDGHWLESFWIQSPDGGRDD